MSGISQCSATVSTGAAAASTNVAGANGGGASAAAAPAGSAATGASLLGGGAQGDIAAVLRDLISTLTKLVEALGAAPVSGGGPAVTQGALPVQLAVDDKSAYSANPGQAALGTDGHVHGELPKAPKKGDRRFLNDSVGPTVKKGKAKTIKIPDGKGFGGAEGRKQNADDKSKNNFSVTDANFSNQLGLLPGNPDKPGKKLNYVQHIQMYAAANYLEAYNQPLYQKLVAAQNAGQGTILGAAAHLMGLVKTADPAEAGLTKADIDAIPEKIPGTPMNARAYVASGKDITGQDWARPHHAGSQFKVLSGLIDAGVNWKNAMVLAGDDGISGSGRLNGVNTQDADKTGMNAGEQEIFSLGAQIQKKTGINVIQLMMGGHNHLGGDPSALTNPKLNKLIDQGKSNRKNGADRADAVYQAFLDGTAGDAKEAKADGTKAGNKGLLKHAKGAIAPKLPATTVAPASSTMADMPGMTTQGSSYSSTTTTTAAPQVAVTPAAPAAHTKVS